MPVLDRCHNASIINRRLDSVSGIAFRLALNGEERAGEVKKRYRRGGNRARQRQRSPQTPLPGIRVVFHRELFQD